MKTTERGGEKESHFQKGIQSVERAFRILDELVRAREPVRLVDIAKAAAMTRNLAHAYLVSLVRVGAVTRDGSGLYHLGETSFQIGLAAITRMDLFSVAREFLQQLLDKAGESVWLSVWSQEGPIVVVKLEGRRLTPIEIRVGTRAQLTVTSTSYAFLAYIDPVHWKHLLKPERQALGSKALNDRQLNRVLKDVRLRGLASRSFVIAHGVTLPQFASIAAPVFDYTGSIRAVLTIIGPTPDFDIAPDGHNARALKDAAARLSARLGFARKAPIKQ